MKQKILLYFFVLTSLTTALANMRAPYTQERFPSYPLSSVSDQFIVKKETLNFACPQVFQNSSKSQKLTSLTCKVLATYEIQSNLSGKYELQFVSTSQQETTVTVNTEIPLKVTPQKFLVKETDLEIYRLSNHCTFCKEPNELFTVTFSTVFQKGTNHISIEYFQPVSSQESDYGYFKDGKWTHSFMYELWPLKEWKLADNFTMQLTFSTITGGVLERFWNKTVDASCSGIDLQYTEYPPSIAKKGERKLENYLKHNLSESGIDILKENSQSYHKEDKLIYEITLSKNFPDRLKCSYGNAVNK